MPNAPIACPFFAINDPNSFKFIPASDADSEKLLMLPPNVAPLAVASTKATTILSAAPATTPNTFAKTPPTPGSIAKTSTAEAADPSSLDNLSAASKPFSPRSVNFPTTNPAPVAILLRPPAAIPAALPNPWAVFPAIPADFVNNPAPPPAPAPPPPAPPPAPAPPPLLPVFF